MTKDKQSDRSNNTYPLKDLTVGKPDKRGMEVLGILWDMPHFKIYKTAHGINLHFSDKADEADAQKTNYLKLGQNLARVNHLIHLLQNDLVLALFRDPTRSSIKYYEREIARCIALALDGKLELAQKALDALTTRISKHIVNKKRIRYFAGCLALAVIIISGSYLYLKEPLSLHLQWITLAAAMGSIGALMSTAVGLRQLIIEAEGSGLLTVVYSFQRVLVGVLGAVIFYIALRTGAVLPIEGFSGDNDRANNIYQISFLSIFAGFSERLVPNFLERESNNSPAGETDGA